MSSDFPGIRQALAARFSLPQYVWLEEIRDRPGFNHRRAADGIAMSVWESRGLELEGVEVKQSRSDWLRELKNPAKADAIFVHMDRWWLAVDDPSIVRGEELPRTWGLLAPRGDKLVAVKEAPKLDPKPLSRGLLAMMLRRAMDRPEKSAEEIEAEVRKRCDEQEETLKRVARSEHTMEMRSHEALKEAVAEFEKAAGVEIKHYHGRAYGTAFRRCLEGRDEWIRERIESMKRDASNLLSACDAAIAKDDELRRGTPTQEETMLKEIAEACAP